ncbi:MAG: penicillin-binding protein activator [Sphingomonadales bacterium]|nr:penicillin-binding protein activator [Sphingomonadales bacterium]
MFNQPTQRRNILAAGTLALLAGCTVIPKGAPEVTPPPVEQPSATQLPTDQQRHRVALLVPLSGPNGAVGQSIANATTMALLDTNADNVRITTYDTATGAPSAAARAIADGNKLILGPLVNDDIPAVTATARAAHVPVISYSNDASLAARDVFIMGSVPGQSLARTVNYAKAQGAARYAALVPVGEYGRRASDAYVQAVRGAGGTLIAMENYDRGNTSIISAARRLMSKGPFDAVLVADGGRFAAQAVPAIKPAGTASPRILGTELWSGETVVASTPALRGSVFSAVGDSRFRQFSDSYKARFGAQPYRIATLGYDSVLLTLRVARDWKPGAVFPTARLLDRGGFLGLDGAFRFGANGVIERALEVREARAGSVTIVSPAATKFED